MGKSRLVMVFLGILFFNCSTIMPIHSFGVDSLLYMWGIVSNYNSLAQAPIPLEGVAKACFDSGIFSDDREMIQKNAYYSCLINLIDALFNMRVCEPPSEEFYKSEPSSFFTNASFLTMIRRSIDIIEKWVKVVLSSKSMILLQTHARGITQLYTQSSQNEFEEIKKAQNLNLLWLFITEAIMGFANGLKSIPNTMQLRPEHTQKSTLLTGIALVCRIIYATKHYQLVQEVCKKAQLYKELCDPVVPNLLFPSKNNV